MTEFDASLYSISVHKVVDGDDSYFEATVSELPDVSVFEDTFEAAYRCALSSIEALHHLATEIGKDFPKPSARMPADSFSGRVTLRLSRRLHAEASYLADKDGVSLNQWLCEAAAVRTGAGTMVDLYRDTVTSFANHAVKFLSFTLLDVTRPRDLTPRASEAPAWRSIQPSQIISLGV